MVKLGVTAVLLVVYEKCSYVYNTSRFVNTRPHIANIAALVREGLQ